MSDKINLSPEMSDRHGFNQDHGGFLREANEADGLPKRYIYKRDHCPQCYKEYERIGGELLAQCMCGTTGIHDNLCPRCGMQNCHRSH